MMNLKYRKSERIPKHERKPEYQEGPGAICMAVAFIAGIAFCAACVLVLVGI